MSSAFWINYEFRTYKEDVLITTNLDYEVRIRNGKLAASLLEVQISNTRVQIAREDFNNESKKKSNLWLSLGHLRFTTLVPISESNFRGIFFLD